jgi:hypothetical protein
MTETFKLAHQLSVMDASNAEAAQAIGKSRTYVSIMRLTFKGASPSLRMAWMKGDMAYSVVKMVATKPWDQQAGAVKTYIKNTKGKKRSAKGEALKVLEKEIE